MSKIGDLVDKCRELARQVREDRKRDPTTWPHSLDALMKLLLEEEETPDG